MIKFNKYTKQIKKKIFLETGYDVSEETINRYLKFYLLNLSYEIKDLKVIKLIGFSLKPSRKTLKSYFKRFPKQDILKPSKLFGLIEVRKRIKLVRQMKKEGYLKN